MKPLSTILTLALLLASATAGAQEPGDSPLTLLYEDTGLLAMAYDVEPLGGPDSTGTFTIAGIPAGALVERAYFITGMWDDIGSATHTLDLDFDGSPYAGVPADVVDFAVEVGGLDLGGYAVDVTAAVPGNGAYPFTVAPNQTGTGTSGALLVVVHSHVSNPYDKVVINFGAEGIRYGNAITDFPGLDATSGTLHVWTQADNAFFSDPLEQITLNGSVLLGGPGGDIFNSNEGCCTSYFEIPVTVPAGTSTVGIDNGQDLFGWHFAALVLDAEPPTGTGTTSWGKVKDGFR
jgi:hypothetical protein